MSKIIVMIVASVILATIFSIRSAQCQRSSQQVQKSEIPCTCIVKGNHITGVKRKDSSHVIPLNVQGAKRKPVRMKSDLLNVPIPF
ncbi:hypothetical protein QTP86_025954 [Hemibagrus guttatus]|nr:hypothetical protein QTP86_025954 [Hemibagrus guttatus]